MSKASRSLGGLVSLIAILSPAAESFPADRPVEQILKELDALQTPRPDAKKLNDQKYLQEFLPKRDEVWAKRAALILELYNVAPRHERTAKLMGERWAHIVGPFPKNLDSLKVIDEILAKDNNPQLRIEGTYIKAVAKIRVAEANGSVDLSTAEEFIKLAPNDRRCGSLLRIAARTTHDMKQRKAIEDRIVKEFPDSPFGQNVIRRRLQSETDQKAKQALANRVVAELPGSRVAAGILGERRRQNAIGKPFELVILDAIRGSTVSIERFKGKVVIIDFWATWCGPCVAKMPHLKDLYAKYHDQGVEFIGVSVDRPENEGGLASLKKFVEENAIPWPQFYDGGSGRFTQSWGIQFIPTVFVVDADGKLYATDAQGKLDAIITELLKNKSGRSQTAAN
jgi:thiol-disulfide isomerase/thioredoxin